MNIALLSVIISVLALDTTIAFQILISSPLFTGPILGWMLGDVKLGFELGFLFQLLWLGRIPAGASIVPEGNVATMIATALVLLNRNLGFLNTTITLVFIEAIIISYLGARITIFYRKLNGKILDVILDQLEHTRFKIIVFMEAGSMLLYFGLMFILTFLTITISQKFLPIGIQFIGQFFEQQLVVVKPVILGIGLALIAPLLKEALMKNTGKKIERANGTDK